MNATWMISFIILGGAVSAKTDVTDAERTPIEKVAKQALQDRSAQQFLRGAGELVLISAARAADDRAVSRLFWLRFVSTSR